mmetsp:Transcript_2539/g.6061  ORF Transcript_2539/g.6061 Transcript_2539/m.6061 type:complete len:194 (+) Transcript_2539:1320-1901(+)
MHAIDVCRYKKFWKMLSAYCKFCYCVELDSIHFGAYTMSFFVSNTNHRKQFPPRKLLDLVDADFEELLLRVSSISAFRTPSAWRITSGKKWTLHRTLSSDSLDSLGNAPASSTSSSRQTAAEMKISNQFIRAKLASGVPIVQKEIPDSHALFRSAFWGTYRYEILKRKRKRGGNLRKFARRIMKRLNSKLKSS